MDLQAILDAPSSSDDDDDKNVGSYGRSLTGGARNFIGKSPSSSLSAGSRSADYTSVVGNSHRLFPQPMAVEGGGLRNGATETVQQLEDDVDRLEIVDRILRRNRKREINVVKSEGSPYRRGHNTSVSGANLELERILANDNDGDDDDDDDEDTFIHTKSRAPYSLMKHKINERGVSNHATSSSTKSTDQLLQSILNEGDDSDDDDDDDYGVINSLSSTRSPLRRASSIAAVVGESWRSNSAIQVSHSFEVDAILNSVQDDDDDAEDIDDGDDTNLSLVMNKYDENDDDENDVDFGLNVNYSTQVAQNISSLCSFQNYGNRNGTSSLSQHPLSSKRHTDDQKEIYIHSGTRREKQSLENSFYDNYTTDGNFLNRNLHQKAIAIIADSDNHSILDRLQQKEDERDDDDYDEDGALLSERRLQQAENAERRLLRPSNTSTSTKRNIASPLAVKRRMKPRVELMTKSRTSSHIGGQQQLHYQKQSHPCFGFGDGIIQTKSMMSKALATTGPLPTAITVNSKFIAIGNQRGEVQVFDLYEQLKIVLGKNGSTSGESGGTANNVTSDVKRTVGHKRNDSSATASSATSSNLGPVTSIDLSSQGDFLLAGYGSGQVILWDVRDVIKGSILTIVDSHSSSICSARFTCIPMTGESGRRGVIDNERIGAVIVDASGLVNKLVFSRGRLASVFSTSYSVETECLLDGTAGQILAMDVLPYHDMATTFDNRIVLIALSSSRSSFAVSVEPKVNVLHRWARPSTERIDPAIGEDDRLTQISSTTNASSYASSYHSTSTYQSTEVLGQQQKKNNDTTPVPYLPCLSWGWSLVSGGGHSITPILARAWGCCLQFLRASSPPSSEGNSNNEDDATVWPAFGTHDEFDASAPVVSLNWLGKRSLVYLTITNEFIIIDTVIMTMQERLDFSQMKLIYAEFALSRPSSASSSNFRPPNSSGCTTFMNSIRSSDNRLLVMCQGEIKEITALEMRQQIMLLEDGGQWLEALALALDHYEGSIKSQEDNQRSDEPSSTLTIVDVITRSDSSHLTEDEIWMAELLMRYLILAIDNAPDSTVGQSINPNRLNLAESHFEMLSGVCLEFCIVTKRLDLLFGPIFRCFYEARFINVFLDVMETYVLHDKLKYIAPEAMVLYVAHCSDMKDLSMVERCLLHMQCNLMDFDSILSLLRKHGLYTGLFHVYSSGLDDFVSPLEILFEAVFDSADNTESTHTDWRKDEYGYKAILYLQYCFKGKSFPKGEPIISEERRQNLSPELIQVIFRASWSSDKRSNYAGPSRHNSTRGIRALSYPFLRALLLVDAKSLLDCLALVFDDPGARFAQSQSELYALGSWAVEFETDNTTTAMCSPEKDDNGRKVLPDRQYLINVLSVIIMSDSLIDSNYHFASMTHVKQASIWAKSFYLDFLAKYLQLGVITTPKSLTGQVFTRQCNKRGASEDTILALLGSLQRSSYELDELLLTFEKVNMTRAALFLHKVGVTSNRDREGMSDKSQHHFHRSIDCYLEDKDDAVRRGVFAYTKKECSDSNSSLLKNAIVQRLPELVKLDSVLAAHLVAGIFFEDIDMILSSLKGIESGRVEYNLLHAILSGGLAKVDSVAAQELSAKLTENHHYLYLQSMANFQPDNVYHYLSNNRIFRLPDLLKLCQQKKIADASAYLLEMTGDVSGALKLMLETFDKRMISLKTILIDCSNDTSPRRKTKVDIHGNDAAEKEIGRIKQILSAVLDLCERNKNNHMQLNDDRESVLWFHILDRLVNVKSLLRLPSDTTDFVSAGISIVLSELLLMAMQRMMPNVSLNELIQKITRDHAKSDLGEFREMLMTMLKTYGAELDVCSSAVNVFYHDIRLMTNERRRLKVRGSLVHSVNDIPRGSILEVGRSGDCRVTNTSVITSQGISDSSPGGDERDSSQHIVLLSHHRQKKERHQARRGNRRGRERAGGDKEVICMMASDYHLTPRRVAGSRQVGILSDAQNVGGLLC